MGLDYFKGCVNFRDVGEWVNCISGKHLLPEKHILRGGKLNFTNDPSEIGFPGTIINLRKGPDPGIKLFGADYFHFPISNDYEKYETGTKEVKAWLNSIFRVLSEDVKNFPVIFHCTSGKDRTGVVIAILLFILAIPVNIIVEEYLLSEGDVRRELIVSALEGIGNPQDYFAGIEIEKIRDVFLHNA